MSNLIKIWGRYGRILKIRTIKIEWYLEKKIIFGWLEWNNNF